MSKKERHKDKKESNGSMYKPYIEGIFVVISLEFQIINFVFAILYFDISGLAYRWVDCVSISINFIIWYSKTFASKK